MFHFINNVYSLNTFFILQLIINNLIHRIIYSYHDQIIHEVLLRLLNFIFKMGIFYFIILH